MSGDVHFGFCGIRHDVFIELKILIVTFTILDVGILNQGRVD